MGLCSKAFILLNPPVLLVSMQVGPDPVPVPEQLETMKQRVKVDRLHREAKM